MKKSNLFTTFLLCVIVIFTFVLYLNTNHSVAKQTAGKGVTRIVLSDSIIKESKKQENKVEILQEVEKKDPVLKGKSLFIGDSRTVGLMEYSQMEKADFFCNVGMSVFNIQDDSLNIPNIGKMTLSELLDHQKYDRIYMMLGINEIGYNDKKIVKKYKELIQFIKKKEPSATIIIQANLHVTSERSDVDDMINNQSINRLNRALSKLANHNDILYLDVNPLFDDQNGNLSADKSSDNTHLYAKYYKDWGQWIVEQTALLMKEE